MIFSFETRKNARLSLKSAVTDLMSPQQLFHSPNLDEGENHAKETDTFIPDESGILRHRAQRERDSLVLCQTIVIAVLVLIISILVVVLVGQVRGQYGIVTTRDETEISF